MQGHRATKRKIDRETGRQGDKEKRRQGDRKTERYKVMNQKRKYTKR